MSSDGRDMEGFFGNFFKNVSKKDKGRFLLYVSLSIPASTQVVLQCNHSNWNLMVSKIVYSRLYKI